MDLKGILMGFALLVSGTANASTVLSATDGDVNFLFTPLASNLMLYMFDDNFNNNFAGATDSLMVDIPSIVGISGPQSGDYLASNIHGSLTLTAAPQFVVAVLDSNTNTWIGDSNPVFYGNGNAVRLHFTVGNNVYAVDVQPVPVPAAVWLFGSGLVGIVAVGRHRS